MWSPRGRRRNAARTSSLGASIQWASSRTNTVRAGRARTACAITSTSRRRRASALTCGAGPSASSMPMASNRIRASVECGVSGPAHWAVVCSRASAASSPCTANMARSRRDSARNAIVVVWDSQRATTTAAPRLAAIAVNSLSGDSCPARDRRRSRQGSRDRHRAVVAADPTRPRGPASVLRCGPAPSDRIPRQEAGVRVQVRRRL